MPAGDAVKILSIDGGGIRGIIPALVLAEIERLTGRPACELFDLIAGTSTGGIIALGVTVPGKDGPGAGKKPRWSAHDLADLYAGEGPKIFHRSLLRTIETVDGLVEQKYAPSGLEAARERHQAIPTATVRDDPASLTLSPMQRRILIALCRPVRDSESATPATNREIAAEVFLSIDAVKAHLRVLFDRFGLGELPQNEKGARLVASVLVSGLLSPREF
jgi:hypothetical protein